MVTKNHISVAQMLLRLALFLCTEATSPIRCLSPEPPLPLPWNGSFRGNQRVKPVRLPSTKPSRVAGSALGTAPALSQDAVPLVSKLLGDLLPQRTAGQEGTRGTGGGGHKWSETAQAGEAGRRLRSERELALTARVSFRLSRLLAMWPRPGQVASLRPGFPS